MLSTLLEGSEVNGSTFTPPVSVCVLMGQETLTQTSLSLVIGKTDMSV